MAPQRLLSLTLVMTSSGAEGLPAPSSRCCACWRAARAASREQAVEQQADLLAALGSPEVRDDRQQLLLQAARSYDRAFNPEGVQRQLLAILAEPSRVPLLNRLQVPTLVIHGTADPLLPVMHGVHVAAHPWLGAEADPRSRPSLPGSLQGAVAGGGGALPEGPSAGQRRPALKPRSRSQACRRTQRPTSTLAATSQASAPPGPARSPGGSARPAGRARRDRRSRG